MLKNRKVFLSGGAGVIGHALVERLLREDARIYVGDLKPRPVAWPKNIKYRQGDLNYLEPYELDEFAPEIFIHLAATFERSIETYEFWEENFRHNVLLSHRMMTLFKDLPSLKKVVFASSYLVYNPELYSFETPAKEGVRLRETDPLKTRNLCGAAKLYHEAELEFLRSFSADKFETVIARIFRSYGKRSRDVISRWIRTLLSDDEITVFKEDGLFDYIYADEVAEGLIRMTVPGISGVINLGNDNGRRIKDIVRILRKWFPDLKEKHRSSEIDFEASQANMDHCRDETNWTPQKQLETAIPEIIHFEKSSQLTKRENTRVHVLVTSLAKKVPLVRALRLAQRKVDAQGSITGADMDGSCIGRHFTDGFWKMPPTDQLTIDRFIDECRRQRITAIIPTRDGELTFFAEHKIALKQSGIHVMVSNLEGVTTCLDKIAFYERLKTLDRPVIFTTENLSQIKQTNVVVKERFGAGSSRIAINVTKDRAQEWSERLQAPVFQPYISGREYSVDVYRSGSGTPMGAVVRSRDLIAAGESQVTTTARIPELEEICLALADELDLTGHLVFQSLMDSRGAHHIIECNSRFGGASSLSIKMGLDSFYWFLLECSGENLDDYEFCRSQKELKQIRHANDLIVPVNGF